MVMGWSYNPTSPFLSYLVILEIGAHQTIDEGADQTGLYNRSKQSGGELTMGMIAVILPSQMGQPQDTDKRQDCQREEDERVLYKPYAIVSIIKRHHGCSYHENI
jgi:hypothetical protein